MLKNERVQDSGFLGVVENQIKKLPEIWLGLEPHFVILLHLRSDRNPQTNIIIGLVFGGQGIPGLPATCS